MNTLNFTIGIAPVTKKNHQQIVKARGRYMVIPSKQYKDYEKSCGEFIPQVETIEEPIELSCLFYMPTHRACDLTNLLQAVCDVLVKHGVIADDNFNIVASVDGSRVLYDKENPRTEVTIKPINIGYIPDYETIGE